MNKSQKKSLEKAGWRVGDAKDFLQLTEVEAEYVEIKASLVGHLAQKRKSLSLSQAELAKQIQSSQSRVAKMEAGDASVSLDLLIRSLLNMGLKSKDLGLLVASASKI